MLRTTSLSSALLASLAPAVVMLTPSSATGAAQTCRGEAATLVGTGENRTVRGTAGRDVVVTNGSDVKTLGGDDLVCVTGVAEDDYSSIMINTGAGNDVVDGTTGPTFGTWVELGEGADRFEGGDSSNSVYGGYDYSASGYQDTEADVLVGGAGADHFGSGSSGANGDVVQLGGGYNSLEYRGTMSPDGSITGGDGSDSISLDTEAGTNVIDNVTGQLVVNGTVTVRWTGIEGFTARAAYPAGRRELEFIGTDADEGLDDADPSSGPATVAFGGGDDSYTTYGLPAPGSRIDAGTGGSDSLYLASEKTGLDLDLATGQLEVGSASPYAVQAPGFDHVSAFAPEVVLAGTDADNHFRLTACEGTVVGRGGNDSVERKYDSWFETDLDCAERFVVSGGDGDDRIRGTRGGDDVLRGGAGRDHLDGNSGDDRLLGGGDDDVLLGSYDADVLIGGAGRDRADGARGQDRCVAEREKRCER